MSEDSETSLVDNRIIENIADIVKSGKRTSVNRDTKDKPRSRRKSSLNKEMQIKDEENGDSPIEEHKNLEQSPTVSRYGRAHKPKISEDFLSTDKKVGAILGLSPQKKSASPSPNVTPKKIRPKIKPLLNGLEEKEKRPRGRPRLKLTNSPKLKDLVLKEEPKFEEKKVPFSENKSDSEISGNNEPSETSEAVEKNTSIVNVKDDTDNITRLSPDTTTDEIEEPKFIETPKPILNVSSTEDGDSDCCWKPGDLAWARVGGHPFWPCIIAIDLQSGVFTKTKKIGRGFTTQRSLHVQFFGDNGRHCWISSNCVIRFEGRDGLQKFADKVQSEMKKKDKKFSTAFIVRPSAKNTWECAVREAEDALPNSREERIRYFAETFPPEIKVEDEDEDNHEISRKRKRSSMDFDGMPHKQIKIEPDSTLDTKPRKTEIKEEKVEVTSPSRKKIKKIQRKTNIGNSGFEVYADKFFHRVSEDHPELSGREVKNLLSKLWADLDDSEKTKYESKAVADQKQGKSVASDDEDDETDTSSQGTRDSSPAVAAVPLKKGAGLFRGTRHERVCQLCFKPGNTVKCKGPCLSMFHLDCIKKPPQIKKESVEAENKRGKKKGNKPSKNGINLKIKSEPQGAYGGDEKMSDLSDGTQNKSDSDDSSVSNETVQFRCKDCSENRPPPCFVCRSESDPKSNNSTRIRCSVAHCGKFYHLECLKEWPQTSCSGISRKQNNGTNKGANGRESMSSQNLICPQHVCHTCASDDPRSATMRFSHDRLVKCVMCPSAYHPGNYCVPAGSEILSGCHIACSSHYEPPPRLNYHVNAAWCFICAVVGGSLICCELCPTAFHAECLRITPPDGGYICEDCDTGRFPLYGEVVWVKLGAYRWWPAQILFPNQIPDNIANLPHVRGEFAVRFFGSHDHYWVNRGRVFLYQEGDTGHSSTRKTSVDGVFQTALVEASEAHKKTKIERSQREAEARPGMKPPSYVRIKSNKPIGNVRVFEIDPASMTPCECDPKSENPCGFDSDCINRILMVECTPGVCPAANRCANQCFVKRIYPALEPFKTEARGWGLRALKSLKKGEFVIEYVGEMIDEEEYRKRLECKHEEKDENYYFLTIDKDRMLDAGPKGNVSRFMNHSCQPNCETQKWTVNGDTRVGLFALQDIPMGRELTFNYNLECVGTDKKPCMCGAPNCSGFIGMKVTKVVEEDKKLKQGKLEPRKRKRQINKLSDVVCFKCGDGGDLLLCDYKTCPKGYHLNCAKRRTWPQGKWLCPWHYCSVCKKRTDKHCGFCPSAFCHLHADGNIRFNSDLGLVCKTHDQISENTVSSSVNEGSSLKATNDTNSTAEKASENGAESGSSNDESYSSADKVNDSANSSSEVQKSVAELLSGKIVSSQTELFKADSATNTLQESISSLQSTPVQPKKKGRPRKYPVGATPEMKWRINQGLSPINNSPPGTTPSIVDDSTVKRKRSEVKWRINEGLSPINNSSPDKRSSLLGDSIGKRKRSEVKWRINERLSPIKNDATPGTSSSLVGDGTVKRKRGRPRKNPLPTTPLLFSEHVSSTPIPSTSKAKTPSVQKSSIPPVAKEHNQTVPKPNTSSEPKANTSDVPKPSTSGIQKPSNSVVPKISTSTIQKPSTSGVAKPSTSGISKPSTAGVSKPSTSGVSKPSTSKPSTSGGSKPSTSGVSKPSTSGVSKPSTSGVSKPSTSGVSKPSTSGIPKKRGPKPRTPTSSKTNNPALVKSSKRMGETEPKSAEKLPVSPGNSNLLNAFTPRTSGRKRQLSEKITAYLNSKIKKVNKPTSPKVKQKPPATSLSPSFYTYTKKTPKKTILQRIDHKPELSKLTFDTPKSKYYQNTPSKILGKGDTSISISKPGRIFGREVMVRTDVPAPSHVSALERSGVRSIVNTNISEVIYQKTRINSVINDDMHTNGILESLNESENQYFDDNVTTIPIKCPEFVQSRNEFLTVENANDECISGLESQLTHSGDTSEKLTEDGKYQILTNVCPETLVSLENSGSLLLHVGR